MASTRRSSWMSATCRTTAPAPSPTREWTTLAAYEARFGVRRVGALHLSEHRLRPGRRAAAPSTPRRIRSRPTAAPPARRRSWAPNCANPVTIDAGWAYPARAADAQTVPLLTDDAGNVYAATTTSPDGREALVLTFAQAPYALHTLQLGYGLVSWATRGAVHRRAPRLPVRADRRSVSGERRSIPAPA